MTAPLADRIRALIAAEGPIPVERWMALCNAHYYATRDPFGPAGDFVTAPEVSQMFGELIGLCLADLWDRAGRPPVHWVELGPGRGTLTHDALRAAAKAGLAPDVHLVETSPVLRAAQARLLPDATWHEDVVTLPDGPLLIVANEFFDALPVHQWVKGAGGWHERLVDWRDGRFSPRASTAQVGDRFRNADHQAAALAEAPEDAILEASPAAVAIMTILAARIARQGGGLLAMDYGHPATSVGETLQAVARHAYASPWDHPGEHDLTVHVDFAALAAAAQAAGAHAHGPVEQGAFLTALGLAQRAAALARARPDQADALFAAYRRLAYPAEMGSLFKIMAVTAADWPAPAGV